MGNYARAKRAGQALGSSARVKSAQSRYSFWPEGYKINL
jgi:hypothetical protein